MKKIIKPPHGPMCDCGWLIPTAFDPTEWASFERPDHICVCPKCGEWFLVEPKQMSFEQAEIGEWGE